MEDIDGGLHPAVDGQSLDEDDEDETKLVWAWTDQKIVTACQISSKLINTDGQTQLIK